MTSLLRMPSTSSFPFLVNKVSSFRCDHEQHLLSIELVLVQSIGVDHDSSLPPPELAKFGIDVDFAL